MGSFAMQIFVNAPGAVRTLQVDPTDTVEAVKLQVEESTGIPASAIALSHQGQCLDDVNNLADYGVRSLPPLTSPCPFSEARSTARLLVPVRCVARHPRWPSRTRRRRRLAVPSAAFSTTAASSTWWPVPARSVAPTPTAKSSIRTDNSLQILLTNWHEVVVSCKYRLFTTK